MAGRRRRVIDEDEDEDNEDISQTNDAGGKQESQVEEKEQKMVVSTMVDRLKRRAARSAEIAQKNKRKQLQTEDNDNDQSPKLSPKTSKTSTKEQSIPKKQKKTQTIPKKSNDENTGMKNMEGNAKKEPPSLLSEMKKPPMPKANVGKSVSGNGKGNLSNTNNSTRPQSSWGATRDDSTTPRQTPGSPSRLSPAIYTSTPPPTTVKSADTLGPLESSAPSLKVEEGGGDKMGLGLRQLVLDRLRELCKDSFETPPERNGVDLFASFLRHKDLQTSNNNTDSSSNNHRYDFFDVHEMTGTIIQQPKIPIFPEDFPAGAKEWPLSVRQNYYLFKRFLHIASKYFLPFCTMNDTLTYSCLIFAETLYFNLPVLYLNQWWGIVEPSIEEKNHEDKAGPKGNAKTDTNSKSRRDRSGARSDSGKEGNGDRSRRDNGRSTSKRSSREIYEDEDAYYDEYPPPEERRDRFPGGGYNDYGGGYLPQPHGTDYDYDHNRPSPNGYHQNSRNPQHRSGGQPFPHHTRDGPSPRSRPYNRDGPPPGEYRGGSRPYQAHGGTGPPPRDYPHRDPYGPHGRGPPPPRDDRREHRDRSQRSPHSRTDRDDGRHSRRKERIRASR